MTLRVIFDRHDLVCVRVASQPDPMWELVLGSQQLRDRRNPRRYGAWRERVRAVIDRLDDGTRSIAPLLTLVPVAGDFPDFLTPALSVTELNAGIEALHRIPADRLGTDLAVTFAKHSPPAWVRRLAAGDREERADLAASLRRAHELLLTPQWGEVCGVVRTDHAVRMRLLADEGLAGLLAGIHGVRAWDGTTLEIDYPCTRTVRLAGRGLTVVPSYFCDGKPVTFVDPELPPVLVYPAVADDEASHADADSTHLDAILSRTRAECLGALTVPRTTSALARAVGVSIATASKQAAILRRARLVESVRDGKSVRHQATALGFALLAGRPRQQ